MSNFTVESMLTELHWYPNRDPFPLPSQAATLGAAIGGSQPIVQGGAEASVTIHGNKHGWWSFVNCYLCRKIWKVNILPFQLDRGFRSPSPSHAWWKSPSHTHHLIWLAVSTRRDRFMRQCIDQVDVMWSRSPQKTRPSPSTILYGWSMVGPMSWGQPGRFGPWTAPATAGLRCRAGGQESGASMGVEPQDRPWVIWWDFPQKMGGKNQWNLGL